MAHIRLIGSRNVKVYPNSACVSYTVPGSGYPAGPQMGGQRKRDLGMPKALPMPKHFVEIAARANEPITASFAFHTESYIPGVAGTGMPGTRSSAGCTSAASFVPQAGRNYEMTATWSSGSHCAVQVFEIRDGATRTPVLSREAEGCPASSGGDITLNLVQVRVGSDEAVHTDNSSTARPRIRCGVPRA